MKKLSFGTAVSAVITCTIALTLAACGGDTTVGPTRDTATPVVASAPAPAAPAPNPSPTPGVVQEGPGYEIEFGDNASFSVKNLTDIGQAYRAYTTSFDNQEVETAFKVSGTVPTGETWGDSFNGSCLQLDITQHGVAGLPLAGGAAFYDKNGKQFNPSRNPEKVAECRTTPCVEKWVPVEYEDAGLTASSTDGGWGQCSAVPTVNEQTQIACSQSRRVRNTCTGEVKTETQSCECSCSQQYPYPGAVDGSGSKDESIATPAVPTYYWYDGENDGIENDCESEGGVFYSSVNIPDDGSNSNKQNVCKTTVNHGSNWEYDHNDYASRESTQNGSPAKYTLSVSASWTVDAGAAQTLTFEIVYIPSNFVKKSTEQSFTCGKVARGSLTWGPGDTYNSSPNYSASDGHITGTYKLRVKRGAAVIHEEALP